MMIRKSEDGKQRPKESNRGREEVRRGVKTFGEKVSALIHIPNRRAGRRRAREKKGRREERE